MKAMEYDRLRYQNINGTMLSQIVWVMVLVHTLVFLIKVPVRLLILGIFVPIFFVFHLDKNQSKLMQIKVN